MARRRTLDPIDRGRLGSLFACLDRIDSCLPNGMRSALRASRVRWAMRSRALLGLVALAFAVCLGCGGPLNPPRVLVRISASASGAEKDLLSRQLERFMQAHPDVRVENQATPESADERHQLYVQWLNAGIGEPDVVQLDLVWTAEFAEAGFVLPLDPLQAGASDWVPAAVSAATYAGRLYAVPWFVDVGMLYYRTDRVAEPPRTFQDLERQAKATQREAGIPYGFVFPAARYEGLLATFLEVLSGFGGQLVDARGDVTVDSLAGKQALSFLDESIRTGVTPEAVLTWQEEQTRFAFQNGRAVFMRNWPYAIPLLRGSDSRVAGRFSVAPMPASPGVAGAGTLGGQELAVNAHSAHAEAAMALVRFLTEDEQVLERARVAGELPARAHLYEAPGLAASFSTSPARLREIVLSARPRPATPVYTEFSEALQIGLHRALTHQTTIDAALGDGAAAATRVLESSRRRPVAKSTAGVYLATAVACCAALGAIGVRRVVRGRKRFASEREDRRLGLALVSPLVVVIGAVAFLPLGWTVVESLHAVDLRHPEWGRPFVGLANFAEAFASARFRGAALRTSVFVVASIAIEVPAGLLMALVLDATFRARGLVRTAVLLPWAIPTVVAALLWRFAFETDSGPVNAALAHLGFGPVAWLSDRTLAWIPVIAADAWKTSPFVALLLLAGLQSIDRTLYEAARVDGAGAVQRLMHVTLPELRPALFVAAVFRGLDAVRAFDVFYVLTGGGPGTATEPVSLLAYQALFQSLRFGFGAALSVMVFAFAFVFVVSIVRSLSPARAEAP